MRKRIFLLAWLMGIIFPVGWLGRFSPAFRRVFDAVFSPPPMHWVMHAVLFAVLALAALRLLNRPVGRREALLALGLVMFVGLAQESAQSFSSGVWEAADSTFDLGVDLAGGTVGLAVTYFLERGK